MEITFYQAFEAAYIYSEAVQNENCPSWYHKDYILDPLYMELMVMWQEFNPIMKIPLNRWFSDDEIKSMSDVLEKNQGFRDDCVRALEWIIDEGYYLELCDKELCLKIYSVVVNNKLYNPYALREFNPYLSNYEFENFKDWLSGNDPPLSQPLPPCGIGFMYVRELHSNNEVDSDI